MRIAWSVDFILSLMNHDLVLTPILHFILGETPTNTVVVIFHAKTHTFIRVQTSFLVPYFIK